MLKRKREFTLVDRRRPRRRLDMTDKKLDSVSEAESVMTSAAPESAPVLRIKNKSKFFTTETFDKWKAWLYLLPALVLLAVFTVYPIFNTVRIAFLEDYTTALQGKVSFKFGLGNFADAIRVEYETNIVTGAVVKVPSEFMQCMKNTLLLCFITVPLSTVLALIIAVCLNSIKFLRKFLQTVFFMPYVTNSIAIGMVFMAMFSIVGINSANINDSTSIGIINSVLGFFGIDPINWVSEGSSYWSNMTVLIIYIIWNALPFKILILLGGLQNVNKQYYEAAKIDSTPRLRVFTRITVPLLSPMIAYVIITGFIGGFKEYSSVIGVFGPDAEAPGGKSMNTIVGYIYECLGSGGATPNHGEASAAALILFGIIFLVTMVNLYVSNKKTHY